ncbi:MAG: bifunctional 2-C-methyl-D-erythritol 4-phosphate cytidylyltransferase/2-C-methyl-D-erythritol 2,4-cyclodiphosphate synthase [Rhodomicrobiaceae bacterium]
MLNAAIIVAAGRGSRASGAGDNPKQYLPVGGQPVLARTLAAFLGHDAVDLVQTVIHADDGALYEAASRGLASPKLLPPVSGGASRQSSVLAGLRALREHGVGNVLIHDAARPFVPDSVIGNVIKALENGSACLAAVPLSDTLKRESSDGPSVAETVARAGLWRAQTPQGFHFSVILAAHEEAARSAREDFTDDAAIAEWRGIDVALVAGSERNIKLTTIEDFALAEQLLKGGNALRETRTGTGFDVHAFEPGGNQVILCGVAIPCAAALSGHSDADVGLHALTDALLGTICAGDIGQHFPPSDPQWKNADSSIFLDRTAKLIAEAGGRVVHADVTLICEYPKVGPYREAMRARIAEILDIAVSRVSVKATTTEGLGFTGRSEGVAAMASATVELNIEGEDNA